MMEFAAMLAKLAPYLEAGAAGLGIMGGLKNLFGGDQGPELPDLSQLGAIRPVTRADYLENLGTARAFFSPERSAITANASRMLEALQDQRRRTLASVGDFGSAARSRLDESTGAKVGEVAETAGATLAGPMGEMASQLTSIQQSRVKQAQESILAPYGAAQSWMYGQTDPLGEMMGGLTGLSGIGRGYESQKSSDELFEMLRAFLISKGVQLPGGGKP